MIEFNNITFIYDNSPQMQHFSCCISSGEKVVLYGPSGHGKSTLLASVAGFVLPDEGSIRINGKILDSVAIQQIRRITAWLPQEVVLTEKSKTEMMTCRDVVAMGRYPYTNYFGRLTKEDEVIVNESLKKVSALDIAENDFSQISDGQRQRIMLMITALLNKKIVLLDEPTSALDPDSISLIIDYIHAMRETTVVMVSHDTRFIEAFDRKIYIGD